FMAQFNVDQKTIEEQMQRQVRNIMQDLGVPRQAELDELRGRLDRLERQLRELENKRW
ncbi:MAG: phasin family protein, partial [Cyanobacteria bacterium J06627_15]